MQMTMAYQENIQRYEKERMKWSKLADRIVVLRVITFVFSLVLIVYLANQGLSKPVWLVIPVFLIGYFFLVNRSNQIAFQKQHVTHLKEINENELLRLGNTLSHFDAGDSFDDKEHSYASDLDVFGKHSLFQLLNRTTTESGASCLARWLAEPSSKDLVINRQQAIKELSPMVNWRQDFQASGLHFKNSKTDYNKLLTWIEKPVQLLPSQTKYLIICIFLSILSTSAAVYYIIHLIQFLLGLQAFSLTYLAPLAVILFINSFVSNKFKPIALETLEDTYHNTKTLAGHLFLIAKIESEEFHSKMLQRLQSSLSEDGYLASREINKLKRILEAFQLRGIKGDAIGKNLFYTIFNALWFLDFYWIILAEKWKNKNRAHIKEWSSAISEFEVLGSLAAFSYSNPSYAFPEIKERPYHIHFEMLGHPLINSERRVHNNFALDGRGKIAMVTGSNMAGKSTFLRTVGLNLVLALMGAPCCARSACVSHLEVFSSMRTQDDLHSGVSSFYAELQRLEQLLKSIKAGKPVFFLLDEMFRGTNSNDRHKGGFSLIKQLADLNTFGMISTHDLELAKLAGKHKLVENYSFNSHIRNDEMFFDYKLTPEICQDFNASELMKRSGIAIIEEGIES